MSGICLLIAPVPVHCFSITFIITGALILSFSGFFKIIQNVHDEEIT